MMAAGKLILLAALLGLAPGSDWLFSVSERGNQGESVTAVKIATLAFPFVGLLMKGGGDGSFWPHCTVTLIRPDAALTARHCVRDHHGADLLVYFPFEGLRQVEPDQVSVFCEDLRKNCRSWVDDLAMIRFAEPMTVIPAVGLANFDGIAEIDQARIIGFGVSDGKKSDNGIRRTGTVVPTNCNSCTASGESRLSTVEVNKAICFYSANITDPAFGSNRVRSLSGDSGGPMVVSNEDRYQLVGLAARLGRSCDGGNLYENRFVNVVDPAYREWMTNGTQGNSDTQSASVRHQVLLAVESARLDAQNTHDFHEIFIPAGTNWLIITMNHEVGRWDPEPGNLDLQLAPDASCSRFVGVEVCTVNNPEPGLITVGVARVHKHVAYQLAAVATFNIAE